MSRLDQNDPEGVLRSHSGERSRSISNRQHIAAIVPVEVDCRSRAFFVGVAVSTVFVQLEVGIFAAIDTKFQRIFGVGSRLHDRSHGHDAALFHEDRHLVNWSICRDGLPSPLLLSRPEVYPLISSRQDDSAGRGLAFSYRIYKEGITEDEFIAHVSD